jgi:hypothetical protein
LKRNVSIAFPAMVWHNPDIPGEGSTGGGMFTISYGLLEKALAVAYGIPESAREAGFRGWVTNLQKLGLFGAHTRVGRGSTVQYGPDELHRLVVALELSEAGIPPASVVSLINAYWEPKIKDIVMTAERTVEREGPPGDDIVLHLGGISLRSGLLKGARSPAAPNINHCRLGELPHYVAMWMKMGPHDPVPPRAVILNLSERLRRFHTALVELHLPELAAEKADKGEARAAPGRKSRRARKGK